MAARGSRPSPQFGNVNRGRRVVHCFKNKKTSKQDTSRTHVAVPVRISCGLGHKDKRHRRGLYRQLTERVELPSEAESSNELSDTVNQWLPFFNTVSVLHGLLF